MEATNLPPEQVPDQPATDESSEGTPADTLQQLGEGKSQDEAVGLLHQLIEQQKAQRAEVAQLRAAVDNRTVAAPPVAAAPLTDQEKTEARLKEVANASHYCPGCGRLYDYARECTGPPAAPHPAIEVVPTSELTDGDPANHTPAPASA